MILVRLLATTLAALLVSSHALAQSWPVRPVTIVNPFAPGGPIDLIARAVAQPLSESWGQPVIVDSRAGAGGNIGIEHVAKAASDGYTWLVIPVGNAVVNPQLYAKLPYDTLRDFAPATMLAIVENVLAVHPRLGVRSLAELITHAKANPGKLSFASSGVGSQAFVAGELLKLMAGIDMLHIPYKGTAPAMNDLLGGQVSLMFVSMTSALANVAAGKVVALGVASPKRSAAAPDLPTIAEQGLAGFEAVSWYALVGPVAVPPAVLTKVARDTASVLDQPAVRERLQKLGAAAAPSSPEALGAQIRRETAFWADFVKRTGIRADQ